MVELTHFGARENSVSSAADAQAGSTEILHVDLSRILEYVSPDELERFENEQFRMEAEAEAIAKRVEVEEEARKYLEKNTRANATGPGSQILSELNTGTSSQSRGRGRERGRGRGRWRGRGSFVTGKLPLADDDIREEMVDIESEEALHRDEEVLELAILETESGSEDKLPRPSPTIARSAFVANSALPRSPVLSHRRASALFSSQRQQADDSSEAESNLELIDADARSMSSAAMQLRDEDDGRARSREDSPPDVSQTRWRGTQSTISGQRVVPAKPSPPMLRRNDRPTSLSRSVLETPSDAGLDDSDEDIPAHPPQRSYNPVQNGTADRMHLDNKKVSSVAETMDDQHDEDGGDSEDAEEYVVETILEHYRDAGKKYYLVKWQGYEDSHDWLPEEDLEGAAELVAEYNAQVRKRKGK